MQRDIPREELVEQMITKKGELLELENQRRELKKEVDYLEGRVFGIQKRPVGRPKSEPLNESESVEIEPELKETKPKRGRPKKKATV